MFFSRSLNGLTLNWRVNKSCELLISTLNEIHQHHDETGNMTGRQWHWLTLSFPFVVIIILLFFCFTVPIKTSLATVSTIQMVVPNDNTFLSVEFNIGIQIISQISHCVSVNIGQIYCPYNYSLHFLLWYSFGFLVIFVMSESSKYQALKTLRKGYRIVFKIIILCFPSEIKFNTSLTGTDAVGFVSTTDKPFQTGTYLSKIWLLDFTRNPGILWKTGEKGKIRVSLDKNGRIPLIRQ